MTKRSMRQRMLAGDLYLAYDPELRKLQARCKRLLWQINNGHPDQYEKTRQAIFELFGTADEDTYVEPPFYCDYGLNIHVGRDFYANTNCVILDVAKVTIGDNVMFGPAVHIYTATHPVDPKVRSTFVESGKPVVIEDEVWIGGMAVINPGVTIGRGSIIGSGAVVTKDIPEMVIAAGNPCHVIRKIDESDKAYWEEQLADYIAEMGPLPW